MANECLERSCEDQHRGWLADEQSTCGVSRLRAQLVREAYSKHRHDTYTVALTEWGVQEFDYRGAVHRSLPGQVVILHPDEPHDGRSATREGFAYRTLYLDPARVYEAVRAIDPHAPALPFVRYPVVTAPMLADVLRRAFRGAMEPLRADAIIHAVAMGLLQLGHGRELAALPRKVKLAALQQAREFLSMNWKRVVRSDELENVCGLSRFELCVQFRRGYGTSPYRFMLMRRLEYVRERLRHEAVLADVAADAGFSDQAHMTRTFKSAFGLTPRRFAEMHRAGMRLRCVPEPGRESRFTELTQVARNAQRQHG